MKILQIIITALNAPLLCIVLGSVSYLAFTVSAKPISIPSAKSVTQVREPYIVELILSSIELGLSQKNARLSAQEYIRRITTRGMDRNMTSDEEKKLSQVGSYLGDKGVKELIAAARACTWPKGSPLAPASFVADDKRSGREVNTISILQGQPITLKWSVCAPSVNITPSVGNLPASGEIEISPSDNMKYTLEAQTATEKVIKTLKVRVLRIVSDNLLTSISDELQFTHTPYSDQEDVHFNSRGDLVAYVAKKADKSVVVVNDKQYPPVTDIEHLAFTPDGSEITFVARRAVLTGRKYSLFVGDKQGEEYDAIGEPIFSLDGKKIAFKAEQDNRAFIVVRDIGGKESRVGEQTFAIVQTPVFSSDSKNIAFAAYDYDKNVSVVCVNGKVEVESKPSSTLTNITIMSYKLPLFDFKSNLLAGYVAHVTTYEAGESKTYEYIYFKGKKSPPAAIITNLVFSINGDLAYTSVKEGVWSVNIFGREADTWRGYAEIGRPVFSPNGETIAYGAREADYRWSVVINGEQAGGRDFDKLTDLVFSQKGDKVACMGRNGNEWVPVVNGIAWNGPGIKMNEITAIKFNSSDDQLLIGGREGRKLSWRAIDLKWLVE